MVLSYIASMHYMSLFFLQDESVNHEYQETWLSDEEYDSEDECSLPLSSSLHADAFRISCAIAAFILTWQYRFFVSNNAVSALLVFLKVLFMSINKVVRSPVLEHILVLLPTTVAMCRKLLKVDKELFTKYSFCVKCSEVYTF